MIVDTYAQVLQFIDEDQRYSAQALRKWADESVADPWLIACANVYDFTIVTFKKSVNQESGNLTGKPKIPNVAKEFNIKVIDLFQMMRELNIKLCG